MTRHKSFNGLISALLLGYEGPIAKSGPCVEDSISDANVASRAIIALKNTRNEGSISKQPTGTASFNPLSLQLLPPQILSIRLRR
jgi:hypothetical protein